MDPAEFVIDVAGDLVTGDVLAFSELVFEGSHRRPRLVGRRELIARVVRESYGAGAGFHVFVLEVLACAGVAPLAPGSTIRRRGKTIHRFHPRRRRWEDEGRRAVVAAEKHARGDEQRRLVAARREAVRRGDLPPDGAA